MSIHSILWLKASSIDEMNPLSDLIDNAYAVKNNKVYVSNCGINLKILSFLICLDIIWKLDL
jgi:hypothetical protein